MGLALGLHVRERIYGCMQNRMCTRTYAKMHMSKRKSVLKVRTKDKKIYDALSHIFYGDKYPGTIHSPI